MGATPEVMEKIVRHLQDERYIDQKRFARLLFVINIALTNGAE